MLYRSVKPDLRANRICGTELNNMLHTPKPKKVPQVQVAHLFSHHIADNPERAVIILEMDPEPLGNLRKNGGNSIADFEITQLIEAMKE